MVRSKQLKFFSQDKKKFFQLNKDWEKITADRQIILVVRFVLFILFIFGSLLLLYYPKLPKQIPFFYSRPWGSNQLADKIYLWFLFVFLFLASFINLIIVLKNKASNRVMANIVAWFTVILCLMGTIDLVKIMTILSIW